MNTNRVRPEEFDLYTILAITHRLPSHLTPYLAILEFMTGEKLTPIMWPRARNECRDWLLEQHPQLRDVVMPEFADGDHAAMDAWVGDQMSIYGATLLVRPLPDGKRAQLGIIDELIDMGVDPNKIYVVNPDESDTNPGKSEN